MGRQVRGGPVRPATGCGQLGGGAARTTTIHTFSYTYADSHRHRKNSNDIYHKFDNGSTSRQPHHLPLHKPMPPLSITPPLRTLNCF